MSELTSAALHPGLVFHRPGVGPVPDPATFMQFVLSENGASPQAKQAFAAYIQFSTKVATAQIEFNNALLKSVG
jgi:hypothetical protein